MRMKPVSYFLLVIMVVVAVLIVSSLMMSYWESKLLPLIVGSITLCLASVELWKEIHAKDKQPEATEERQADVAGESRRLRAALGWVAGATLGVYLLGFLLGIALFILSFLKSRHRSWAVSLAVAAIATALIYVIFELALASELYRGLIYERITG